MKIALISLYGIENIGIRLISAALKKEKFFASTIYIKKWVNNNIHPPTEVEIKHIINLLKSINPSVIGIGFGSPYFAIAKELTRRIKQAVDAFVVWGGIHPTIVPERCIEFADIVCVGEGEYPMLELVNRMREGKSINDIKNLWIRTEHGVVTNDIRPLIQNLDVLAFPDLDNQDKYYIEDNKIVQREPFYKSAEYRIIASRGCLFNCSYCYNSVLRNIYKGSGKYLRQRSADNVVAELEYALKINPRLRHIKFDDDAFVFSEEWIERFSYLYRSRIGLPFEIFLNPTAINEADLWKLKKAGLRWVQIGIQSVSENEQKECYNRSPNEYKNILQFAEFNKNLKIDVVYDIIIDNPLSTTEDKKILFEFLMRLPHPFRVFLYSLTIFPKTELADKMLKLGLITEKEIEGEASKSFRQFRVSFNYPRPKEDRFYMSLYILSSKNFIPKKFINWLYSYDFLRRHPYCLELFTYLCNLVRISWICFMMLKRGELTSYKFKEYGSLKFLLSQ